MIRPRRSPLSYLGAGLAASLALASALPSAHAQRRYRSSGLSDTASIEVARRQALAAAAEGSIVTGDQAMDREDYELAMRSYKIAVDALPPTDAIGNRRAAALAKFFDATMKRAEQLIVEGHYGDAEITAKIILQPEYDPTYQPAIKLLAHLDDPEYYNQTSGPKFLDKVQQVKQLFSEAQGFYDSGRYELAFKRYEQILALDPTNTAARRGEERITHERSKYYQSAYNEQRGRAVAEVEAEWQRPVRRFGLAADPRKNYSKTPDAGGTAAITRKLSAIVIPNIEFRQTTIRDAIEYLRQESRRLDISEPDPDKRGVNIFLKISGGAPRPAAPAAPTGADVLLPGQDAGGAAAPVVATASADQRISLTLSRIPLLEALRYVATQAGLKVKVEPYAVSIVPLNELVDTLINAEFRVAPSFIGTTSTGGGGGGALNQGPTAAGAGGGGTVDNTGAGAAIISRQDAKTFLEQSGVVFPPGASATYIASTSKLVVRNTQDNIDIIERLVEQNVEVIRQVEIESKFVEINQTNVKELSFDVGLGAANVPGSSRLFVLGGTAGASSTGGATTGSGTTGFSNPNGSAIGGFPVTSGNRTGGFAISANAIDALLFGSGAAAAPGIFSLAGVFTDPQFQIVMRALNQSKGVDLLSAPRVTTKSGQKATIEIIREFLYPTQFQPPQIPQNFGNGGNISLTGAGGGGGQSFPVTPTTPTNFEKRNTGVTLEVDPVIGPDNFTIDLTLQPQVVDFEGFINYGSPIQTISSNPLGVQSPIVLTPNIINQPVFSTRRVSTSVTVYDGSTVVLGGLVREDIQKVNDKVPILGDIPLAGRLFRSKVDQNIKRNLIIFVTARLIDPSGQPLLNTEEDEEAVPSLIGPDTVVTQTVSGYSKDK